MRYQLSERVDDQHSIKARAMRCHSGIFDLTDCHTGKIIATSRDLKTLRAMQARLNSNHTLNQLGVF